MKTKLLFLFWLSVAVSGLAGSIEDLERVGPGSKVTVPASALLFIGPHQIPSFKTDTVVTVKEVLNDWVTFDLYYQNKMRVGACKISAVRKVLSDSERQLVLENQKFQLEREKVRLEGEKVTLDRKRLEQQESQKGGQLEISVVFPHQNFPVIHRSGSSEEGCRPHQERELHPTIKIYKVECIDASTPSFKNLKTQVNLIQEFCLDCGLKKLMDLKPG